MQQRLGIAQALLGSPDLLVLDEVSSGLDPVGRRHLRHVMSEIKKRGRRSSSPRMSWTKSRSSVTGSAYRERSRGR
jgi:ABC-type uncharacterized transport system ATPase subunit